MTGADYENDTLRCPRCGVPFSEACRVVDSQGKTDVTRGPHPERTDLIEELAEAGAI